MTQQKLSVGEREINLTQVLKLANLVMSGGEAKMLIAEGRVRVNGATKLWKRDLFRYRIPVKAGMNVYNEITNETEIGTFDSTAAFLYSETDPNTCPHRRAIAQAGALVQGPRL